MKFVSCVKIVLLALAIDDIDAMHIHSASVIVVVNCNSIFSY